jgi:hypothetical protein
MLSIKLCYLSADFHFNQLHQAIGQADTGMIAFATALRFSVGRQGGSSEHCQCQRLPIPPSRFLSAPIFWQQIANGAEETLA